MTAIQLGIKTVTPALVNLEIGHPELRPPSFRGMMRYWFRAASGAVVGQDLTGLRLLEDLVFGSPERSSSFSLQVFLSSKESPTRKVELLPHKEIPKERVERDSISEGYEFFIILQTSQVKNNDLLEAARLSLHLGLLFGNVGLRSRRGFGTMDIVSSDPPGYSYPDFPDELHLTTYISSTVSMLNDVIRRLAVTVGAATLAKPAADILDYPAACTTSDIRLSNDRYTKAIDAINHFIAHVPAYPSLGSAPNRQLGTSRQASPLWVRPIKVGKAYALLFTLLPSVFVNKEQNYAQVQDYLGDISTSFGRIKGWNA